jgi:hypothetical protein
MSATYKLAVSANDAKVQLENGATRAVKNPQPDSISIIDLTRTPPVIIAQVEAPTSVAGPPYAVAVTPDESLALVSAATQVDLADATKIISNNVLSVMDLKATPPRVIQTV